MKKHKGLIICLIVLVVLGIVAFIGVRKLLYPDNNKSKYGDRLDGIENYKISEQTISEMKEEFLKNEFVTDFNYNLTGRIVKVTITVKSDTEVEKTQELSSIITKALPEDYQKYYDISYYVVSNEENDLYPIVGTKHKTSEVFSWTIKREVKEEEKGVEDEE